MEVNDRTVLFRRKFFNPFIAVVLLAQIPPFSHLCIVFTVTDHSHIQLRNVINKCNQKEVTRTYLSLLLLRNITLRSEWR